MNSWMLFVAARTGSNRQLSAIYIWETTLDLWRLRLISEGIVAPDFDSVDIAIREEYGWRCETSGALTVWLKGNGRIAYYCFAKLPSLRLFERAGFALRHRVDDHLIYRRTL